LTERSRLDLIINDDSKEYYERKIAIKLKAELEERAQEVHTSAWADFLVKLVEIALHERTNKERLRLEALAKTKKLDDEAEEII